MHRYTTEQIEAEIARRKAQTPEGRALERMGRSWASARQITKLARMREASVIGALRCLCEDGKAQFNVSGKRVLYRAACKSSS